VGGGTFADASLQPSRARVLFGSIYSAFLKFAAAASLGLPFRRYVSRDHANVRNDVGPLSLSMNGRLKIALLFLPQVTRTRTNTTLRNGLLKQRDQLIITKHCHNRVVE
jgi:hypothetical protein